MSKSHINSSRRQACSGQALIEFALVMPLLFMLIINVLNFGGLLYAWITVANASRTGVQYMMMGTSTVHATPTPSPSAVAALVRQDLYALPNQANASVVVCKNVEATSACTNGPASPAPSVSAAASDPESTLLYCLGTVDVIYPYQPFVRYWDFSKLGVGLPSMFNSSNLYIRRRAVMRMAGGCSLSGISGTTL